jgi:hypothetical protein
MSDRSVTGLILAIVLGGLVWALYTPPVFRTSSAPVSTTRPTVLSPEMIPLVSGDEPIATIFTKAGCPVCHTIPGIAGAEGRVGPPLLIGMTGPVRLRDPAYRGRASTVHDYVIESVLEPGLFVVPGYLGGTMPTWYGQKLSALALEKIAVYLEEQRSTSTP